MTTAGEQATGRCLCGAVRLTATLSDGAVQACHCTQCQRWTGGGPYFAIRVHELVIEGGDNIAAYHASDWGERAFCRTCGSSLYWRLQGHPVAFIAPGLLDDQAGLTVADEIFVDHRAPWVPPWPNASQSTEAEELAKLDPFLKGDAP